MTHSPALRVVKSELRLYEKTAEAIHLAHAQRALQELLFEQRRGAAEIKKQEKGG